MINQDQTTQNLASKENLIDLKELFNLQCWALTCESFLCTKEWLWLYKSFNYNGDYEFIFFE